MVLHAGMRGRRFVLLVKSACARWRRKSLDVVVLFVLFAQWLRVHFFFFFHFYANEIPVPSERVLTFLLLS